MIRLITTLAVAICSTACYASGGDTRPLKDVFSESSVILYGAVVGAGIGACAGKDGVNSYYIVRVTDVVKGDVQKGDIKACGSAPIILANQYLIAGDRSVDGEIVFSPDAVLLVFPSSEYYRLISHDGPIVTSDRGKAYTIGLLESDFLDRFSDTISTKEEGKK